ncbi:MAG: LPXTG cell wall anchor domain-containing protein [Aeromicrobium sp.]
MTAFSTALVAEQLPETGSAVEPWMVVVGLLVMAAGLAVLAAAWRRSR